jgi:ATP-dependent protease HslVU (ClpYQ) peptidase subunit
MTILVGYTYKGKSMIGSDSRMLILDDEISSQSKIVEFPNFLVGHAGNIQAKSILYKVLNRRKPPRIKDYWSCIRFHELVYTSDKLDFELLVVTKNGKIFVLDKDSVVEYNDWACIGSGASYAKTVMSQLYPKKECIVKSIEKAIEFSASCGFPIAIKEI